MGIKGRYILTRGYGIKNIILEHNNWVTNSASDSVFDTIILLKIGVDINVFDVIVTYVSDRD